MRRRLLTTALILSMGTWLAACGIPQQTASGPEEQRGGQQARKKPDAGFTAEAVEEADPETGIAAGILAMLGDTTAYLEKPVRHDTAQGSAQKEDMQKESTQKGSGKGSGLKVDSSITDGDSALGTGTAESSKTPEAAYNAAGMDANSSDERSAYKDVSVEFVSYPPQTISPDKKMVLSNLSANAGIEMGFAISYGGEELVSGPIRAGEAWHVDVTALGLKASDMPYSLTVTSTAYPEGSNCDDDEALNSVKQTVSVTVEGGASEAQGSDKHAKQLNGQRYTTAVTHSADTTRLCVILPAVVAVERGVIGTDIYANFLATNAKGGMTAKLEANGDGGGTDITLAGSGTKIKARLSSAGKGSPMTSYRFKGGESKMQRVGPIHCTISSGKRAVEDYYGTIQFDLKVEGI